MNTATLEHAEYAPAADIGNLTASQVGMISFLASEVAFFSTLIVAYLTFMGKDTVGPTPREALSLPLALGSTFFLLASSATIHQAERSLHRGASRAFAFWWGATILLGAVFLAGTAYEWSELIRVHHLTISRNLFGTTYYTLVGFHALHVTCGLIAMAIVLGLAMRGRARAGQGGPVQLVGWYWHFVDAVWIVVFSIVYLLSTLG